jgi:hypothetical protein
MNPSNETSAAAAATGPAPFDAINDRFICEFYSGGMIKCAVRFPTDKQWIERQKHVRIQVQNLGRDKSRTQGIVNEEHDLELFKAIRIEGGEDFDEYEGSHVITLLTKAEAAATGSAGGVDVRLKVFGGRETVHSLRAPRRKQIVNYSEAHWKVTDGKACRTIQVALETSAQLYDQLVVSTEGYADGSPVPIIHKNAVITELMEFISPERQAPEE